MSVVILFSGQQCRNQLISVIEFWMGSNIAVAHVATSCTTTLPAPKIANGWGRSSSLRAIDEVA